MMNKAGNSFLAHFIVQHGKECAGIKTMSDADFKSRSRRNLSHLKGAGHEHAHTRAHSVCVCV